MKIERNPHLPAQKPATVTESMLLNKLTKGKFSAGEMAEYIFTRTIHYYPAEREPFYGNWGESGLPGRELCKAVYQIDRLVVANFREAFYLMIKSDRGKYIPSILNELQALAAKHGQSKLVAEVIQGIGLI